MPKHGSNRKRAKSDKRLNMKIVEEGNSPLHSDSLLSYGNSRSDSRTTETSFMDQVSVLMTRCLTTNFHPPKAMR